MVPHRAPSRATIPSVAAGSCVAVALLAGAPAAEGGAYEGFDYAPGTPVTEWRGGSGWGDGGPRRRPP